MRMCLSWECSMTLEELKSAVSQLSDDELNEFTEWFEEYAGDIWDKRFEEDVKAGKFDALAEQAMADFEAGRYTEL